ncbi:hypothetical protein KI387_031994, partial [Taxus chinensis]
MGNPHSVRRSPRLSPQKEENETKRRKLKLNEEVEDSGESVPRTPVQLEDVEDPRYEDMKYEEKEANE